MTGDPSGRENLGPPPPVFRLRARPPRHIRWLVPVVAAIAALIALYLVLDLVRSIYTNLLWFDSVGYGAVYKTRIKTRVWLFFAGARGLPPDLPGEHLARPPSRARDR